MPNSSNNEKDELESSTTSVVSAADELYDQVAPLCTCGHGIASSSFHPHAPPTTTSSPSSSSTGGKGGVSNSSSTDTGAAGTSSTTTKNKLPSGGGATSTKSTKKYPSSWLGSSFVHLVTPTSRGGTGGSNHNKRNHIQYTDDPGGNNTHNNLNGYPFATSSSSMSSHPFVQEHELLLRLLDAANGLIDDPTTVKTNNGDNQNGGGGEGLELCTDCIDRVAEALEADTRRLYGEVERYEETITAARIRSRTLHQQVVSSSSATTTADNGSSVQDSTSSSSPSETLAKAEEVYRQEIAALEQEVQMREDELHNLVALYQEHIEVSHQLDKADEILEQEQNALELESKAFDYRRTVLSSTLADIQDEMDKLCIVPLPSALWDLQVDPRGLRYPLINQLRLAFQPKGDVQTKEIQVAWSQATQLLLFLGKLFDYPSQDWRVVPLADCAKLIYRKEIFNLSPGNTRSLLAWNALLDQVVKYAWSISSNRSSSSSSSSRQQQHHQQQHHQATMKLRYSTSSTPTRGSTTDGDNNTTPFSSSVPPPFPSTPTSIGDTELARLDRNDHVGWSQVIHRMASNLLWLSDRACERAALQVSSAASCVV